MALKLIGITPPHARVPNLARRLHRLFLEPDRVSFFLVFCLIVAVSLALASYFRWPPEVQYLVGASGLALWLLFARCRP